MQKPDRESLAKKLLELKRAGKSYSELGKMFNISPNAVKGLVRTASLKSEEDPERSEFEKTDKEIKIVCSSKRVLSEADLVEKFNVDLNEWEIVGYKIKTSEGYRKDRSVEWHVTDGKVLSGDVSDSGKMLVVPLYHIEVRLIKKKAVYDAKLAIDALKEDAKAYAPAYSKISYPEIPEGCLYEIDMQDIHFGRLTWEEESGDSYDVNLAKKAIESTLTKLLGYVTNHAVSRILIPMGNDFFNVDNKLNTTTKGTPQQEDTRWQKTYKMGREICVWMIETCSQVAPVDVLMIPGNHDEQRSFYLGDSLECWFNHNPNVRLDNNAAKQKYYAFGANLIGFAHGYDEKLSSLPFLMANDQSEMWAKSKYREWHTGDKHHKVDLITKGTEKPGMMVRILRSLAAEDAWTFNSGYRSLRASEAFLWHPDNGLIAQYTATPDL